MAEPEAHNSPGFTYKLIGKWAPEALGGGVYPLRLECLLLMRFDQLYVLNTPAKQFCGGAVQAICERQRHFNQMAQMDCRLCRCLSSLLHQGLRI